MIEADLHFPRAKRVRLRCAFELGVLVRGCMACLNLEVGFEDSSGEGKFPLSLHPPKFGRVKLPCCDESKLEDRARNCLLAYSLLSAFRGLWR